MVNPGDQARDSSAHSATPPGESFPCLLSSKDSFDTVTLPDCDTCIPMTMWTGPASWLQEQWDGPRDPLSSEFVESTGSREGSDTRSISWSPELSLKANTATLLGAARVVRNKAMMHAKGRRKMLLDADLGLLEVRRIQARLHLERTERKGQESC